MTQSTRRLELSTCGYAKTTAAFVACAQKRSGRMPRTIINALVAIATLCAASPTNANPANQKLLALSEPERRKVVQALMRRSGEVCRPITVFYQGNTASGDAVWNLLCDNKKSWALLLNNDATGGTRLLQCDVLRAATGVACFRPF